MRNRIRGPKVKGTKDRLTEHLGVMLRPRERYLLERVADGEALSSYARRVLRAHLNEQLGVTPLETQG